METINLAGIPATVAQTVKTLNEFYAESLPEIRNMSQREFIVYAHFGAGLFIRNSWCLHWHEGHSIDRGPREKPALVKFFNDLELLTWII